MKNRIKQYLLAASMCVGLTACSDFFEPIPGVQFGLDETFASKQRTEEYLNNVYSYVREVTDAIHPNTYGGIFTEASLDGANRWNKTYADGPTVPLTPLLHRQVSTSQSTIRQ